MVNMSKSLIFICLLMSSILVLGGFLRREVDEQDKSKHYKSFLGKWEVRNQVQQYLFTIDFFYKNEELIGQHCFVSNDGGKIDCFQGNDMSIFIRSRINKSEISFWIRSSFSDKSGIADIRIINEKLIWNLKGAPAGEQYFPEYAILYKTR